MKDRREKESAGHMGKQARRPLGRALQHCTVGAVAAAALHVLSLPCTSSWRPSALERLDLLNLKAERNEKTRHSEKNWIADERCARNGHARIGFSMMDVQTCRILQTGYLVRELLLSCRALHCCRQVGRGGAGKGSTSTWHYLSCTLVLAGVHAAGEVCQGPFLVSSATRSSFSQRGL